MIRYSTNWMGPINAQWIRENGNHWAAGRIDCSPTEDNPWGTEIGLPAMHQSDWNSFSRWLWDFQTDTVWTLKELTEEYEKTNPKITWWKDGQR